MTESAFDALNKGILAGSHVAMLAHDFLFKNNAVCLKPPDDDVHLARVHAARVLIERHTAMNEYLDPGFHTAIAAVTALLEDGFTPVREPFDPRQETYQLARAGLASREPGFLMLLQADREQAVKLTVMLSIHAELLTSAAAGIMTISDVADV